MPNAVSTPSSRLTVSVIIPVHQDGVSFRKCISALAEVHPQPEEVLLISDGAGASIESVAADFGYRCLQNPSGIGPAKARNYGASVARCDLLFFIDSDVAISHDSVSRVLQAFEEDPGTDALIGSYDNDPAETNFLSQYKNLIHHYVHQHSKEAASTFWGACGAIRRDVFLALGGFDEHYRRPCVEDIEFGYRMTKAGYRIRLQKALQGKHLKKWGVQSLIKTDLMDRAIPWTELILRDRMLTDDLDLRISNRLSIAFVFAFISLLLAAFWHPMPAVLSLLFIAAYLLINLPLYKFFFKRRKLLFALKAVPWHIIYCVCCGLGFAAGSICVLLGKLRDGFGKDAAGKKAIWIKKGA